MEKQLVGWFGTGDCPIPKLDVVGSNPIARSDTSTEPNPPCGVSPVLGGAARTAEKFGKIPHSRQEADMPRKLTFPPYPKRPHASGKARISVQGVTHYLGAFNSPESWAECQRLLGEWRRAQAGRPAGGPAQAPAPAAPCRTLADVLARFLADQEKRRRDPETGGVKEELGNYAFYLRLPGHRTPGDFVARDLEQLRDAMADGSWMTAEDLARARRAGRGRGWARTVVNRTLARVKYLFAWAERRGHVPEGRAHHLDTVPGFEL